MFRLFLSRSDLSTCSGSVASWQHTVCKHLEFKAVPVDLLGIHCQAIYLLVWFYWKQLEFGVKDSAKSWRTHSVGYLARVLLLAQCGRKLKLEFQPIVQVQCKCKHRWTGCNMLQRRCTVVFLSSGSMESFILWVWMYRRFLVLCHSTIQFTSEGSAVYRVLYSRGHMRLKFPYVNGGIPRFREWPRLWATSRRVGWCTLIVSILLRIAQHSRRKNMKSLHCHIASKSLSLVSVVCS